MSLSPLEKQRGPRAGTARIKANPNQAASLLFVELSPERHHVELALRREQGDRMETRRQAALPAEIPRRLFAAEHPYAAPLLASTHWVIASPPGSL
jgi:hypothetical protein